MELVLGCAESAWRCAVADLQGEVVACEPTAEGLELRARLGQGDDARPFVARWYLDSGVLCEGAHQDIAAFNAACARHGFRFRLDQIALCG